MSRINEYAQAVQPLLGDVRSAGDLECLLLAESRLPGPRGNLEMVAGFVRAFLEYPSAPSWVPVLLRWTDVSAEQAPTGTPEEFPPFCAVVALGALYGAHRCSFSCDAVPDCPDWPVNCGNVVRVIRRAGNDSRWRQREAAAMALQHIGERDSDKLWRILDCWLETPTHTDRRAVLAALAHLPLLADEVFCRRALAAGDRILKDAAAIPVQERRSEEFRILVKGLSYALSVLAASLPEEGLNLLERWTVVPDPIIHRVLRANLKKRRLQSLDPARTARLLDDLSAIRDASSRRAP